MAAITPLGQFNFHHVLAETSGASLVLLTRRGCGSCRHWKRLLEACRDELRVFELDAERDAALAGEFAVFYLPALFLCRDGHFHAALQSEASPERLRAAIASALAAPPQELH